MRGDRCTVYVEISAQIFQFTPLREGRPKSQQSAATDAKFQFTPLREGRRAMEIWCVSDTPTFQFTPLREGRQRQGARPVARIVFQFTPLREGRLGMILVVLIAALFQFTPLREGRLICAEHGKRLLDISIHAPA